MGDSKAHISIHENVTDLSNARAWHETMTEWDADPMWEQTRNVRESIMQRFAAWDPLVQREFRPTRDAWQFTTYLQLGAGKVIRMDVLVENRNTDDGFFELVDPETVIPRYERLLETAGYDLV